MGQETSTNSLTDAYERIVNFARRFGEPHIALAMQAALPLGLTPELVHLIRVNFVRRAPMIAEADLLLSPLCREVGGELYEMYPEVRDLLLAELMEDTELGEARINELAEFLMVYSARNFNPTDHSELRNFLVAQQWTALAHLRPAEAAQLLASALGRRLSAHNPAGSVRLAQLARTFKTQLMGQDNVLTYAAAIERLAIGDADQARELFGILGATQQSPVVKSVALPALHELAKLWPEAAISVEPSETKTSEQQSSLPAHITLRDRIAGTDSKVRQAAWSPDGKTIALVKGLAIHLWDVETKRMRREVFQTPFNVRCFAWSPDSLSIAAGLVNDQLWIGHFSMTDSPILRDVKVPINDVLWSPDQRWLAAAMEDGTVQVRDTRIWREGPILQEFDKFPRSAAWSPTGASYLVVGYTNGFVIAWDTNSWNRRRTYKGHTAAVNSVAISPGRAFFASGSDDGTVRVWRIDETDDNYQIVLKDHSGPVTRVCFSSNGKLLASKSNDGAIRLWRHPDWQCVAVVDASAAVSGQPPLPSSVLAFHPSEPLLAACIENNSMISILEIDQEALLRNAEAHQPEAAKPVAEATPPEPVQENDPEVPPRYLEIEAVINQDFAEDLVFEIGVPGRTRIRFSTDESAVADVILAESKHTSRFNEALAESLTRQLIPEPIQLEIRESPALLFSLDQKTAQYPWEFLLKRSDGSAQPLALAGELMRRFKSTRPRATPNYATERNALVINDAYSRSPELPGAAEETTYVATALSPRGYKVTYFNRGDANAIVNRLHERECKILHLSSRVSSVPGDTGSVGIMIGEKYWLTSQEIAALRAIPELVFLNFLHADYIGFYSRMGLTQLNQVAATLAEEWMAVGIKALVITGWMVDENATLTFTSSFYDQFLNGLSFGEAMLFARRQTYERHRQTNTWGAFQCYGDPDFRLSEATNPSLTAE